MTQTKRCAWQKKERKREREIDRERERERERKTKWDSRNDIQKMYHQPSTGFFGKIFQGSPGNLGALSIPMLGDLSLYLRSPKSWVCKFSRQ